jgi:3-oxoacyl-[acyl-carrier-protein] synthase II
MFLVSFKYLNSSPGNPMINKRRVVITGLGMATSLGLDIEENWQKALSGVSGIRKLSLPNTEKSPVQAVGSVAEADWNKIQDEFKDDASKEGERRTLCALWAVQSAMKDAGLIAVAPHAGPQRDRCWVVMAAGLGINRLEDIHRWMNKEGRFDYLKVGQEYNRQA